MPIEGTGPTGPRLARSLWCITLFGVGVIAVITATADDPTSDETSPAVLAAYLFFVLAFATTGALIASRHPGNPVGWIAGAAALLYVAAGVADSYINTRLEEAAAAGASLRALLALGQSLWAASLGLGATFLLLLFPDGHLPSRRWRPVAWTSGLALALVPLGSLLMPGDIQDYPVTNPLGIRGAEPLLGTLTGVGLVLLLAGALLSMASLFFRYRRSGLLQRQQLKWLLFSVVVVATLILAGSLIEARADGSETATEIANLLSTLGLTVIPIAIGVAILRHRLYDIDLIINRALVYGALTASLLVAYVAIVFGLQQALSPFTEQSDVAVAASTLAVAALFRPARSRLQAFIDRRFYRRKFDAQRTLEDFGAAARTEVGLGPLSEELVGVVRQTMEPAHVSLWLRRSDTSH